MPPSAADALCRVLRDGDDAHRFYAAQALGRIGAVAAVPTLIEVLRDDDPDVRSATAEALGVLGDTRAVEPLLENLSGDPSSDVKLNAVVSLGKLGDDRAVPLLRELVRSRGEEIVWDEEEFLSGGWDDWLDVQLRAIEALADIGASGPVPDIMAAMDDPDGQDLSAPGCQAMSRLGEAGIDALGQYLDHGSARMRRSAARALVANGGHQSQRPLRRALNDPLPEIRLIALRALASADPNDPDVVPCLRDGSAAVRAEAVRHCGTVDADTLDTLLDDPDDTVQQAVIHRLTQPGTAQPANLQKRLRVKLRGPSEAVAIAAAAHLTQLAPDVALTDLTEQAMDQHCPAGLRSAAVDTLGTLTDPAAIDPITTALADDERRVRIAATVVLGRLAAETPSARAALLSVLAPPPPATEQEASDAAPPSNELAPVSDDDPGDDTAPTWPTSTLAALQSTAETSPIEPAESVDLTEEDLAFLELAGRRSRRKHVPLEPDVAKDIDIRRMAARVAGDLPDESIVAALARCLSDTDLELRRNAADSLARLASNSPSVIAAITDPVLTAASGEKESHVRGLLLRALGTQHDPAIGQLLTRELSDENSSVRVEAIQALANCGSVGAAVEARLADMDPSVRLAAAAALARNATPARVDKLVAQAFAFEGQQRQEIGRLLHDVAPDSASAAVASVLLDDTRRREWRIAIETLQEVRRPPTA